jgi:hypothetical protein
MLTILCIATYFKGEAFLRECRRAGCTVLLLTNEQLTNADWPRDVIDEIHGIAREADDAAVRRAADAIVRRHPVDRIAAIDDFDVETAAMLREHLQVAGMGRTTASRFRDKLTMRVTARDRGIRVPEFTPVFNDRAVNEWIARVPPPWVLKPRSSAGAIGIKKVNSGDELWQALHAAADKRSACMLEQFVAGEVYHVDSIIWNMQVVFAVACKYGRPPMQIAHEGGIFVTRRVPDTSAEGGRLLDINARLQQEFGMRRGVSHTEFIGSADGLCSSKRRRESAARSSPTRLRRPPTSICGVSGQNSRSPVSMARIPCRPIAVTTRPSYSRSLARRTPTCPRISIPKSRPESASTITPAS